MQNPVFYDNKRKWTKKHEFRIVIATSIKMNDIEEKLKPLFESRQYWKAKQIVRRMIKNSNIYDPELFGLYGKVLAKMHDDLEAGKYFFLSGLRGPEYDDKINLFISRYKKSKNKRYISLSCQFPKIARYRKMDDFPEPTRSDILKLGLKEENEINIMETQNSQDGSIFKKIRSRIFWVFIYLLIIIFIVSIPVGIIITCKWKINVIF